MLDWWWFHEVRARFNTRLPKRQSLQRSNTMANSDLKLMSMSRSQSPSSVCTRDSPHFLLSSTLDKSPITHTFLAITWWATFQPFLSHSHFFLRSNADILRLFAQRRMKNLLLVCHLLSIYHARNCLLIYVDLLRAPRRIEQRWPLPLHLQLRRLFMNEKEYSKRLHSHLSSLQQSAYYSHFGFLFMFCHVQVFSAQCSTSTFNSSTTFFTILFLIVFVCVVEIIERSEMIPCDLLTQWFIRS